MGSRITVSIGELCSFSKGASVPRARMLDEAEWKYIHYGDLYKGFDLYIDIDKPSKPIPCVSAKERARDEQFVQSGDIVYVLTSETVDDLGHAFLVRNAEGYRVLSGTETTVMRVERQDLVMPAYLNYLLHTARFKKLLRQYVTGMKVFRVHPRDVSRIEIDIPSLNEQRIVVSMLDKIYDKLAINTQLNDYLAELCEVVAGNYCEAGDACLNDICHQVTERRDCGDSDLATYVSTESLLQNKQGRQTASSLPVTGKVTCYRAGDTLLSNIRPYFKKIWYAPFDGTCSGDVLVFRAKEVSMAPYLHACLRQDRFFDHVMRGAKGTKMPRGDKKQMMEFVVSLKCDPEDLAVLNAATMQIAANASENEQLADLRDALLPKLMSGEIDVSKVDLTQLNNHLAES